MTLAAAAALATAWISTGSDAGVTAWWLSVVVAGLLLPGWAVVRCVRGGRPSATDLGWAGPTGLVVALLTWLVGHLVGVALPTLVVGPLLAATVFAVPALRRRALGDRNGVGADWPVAAWLSIGVTLLLVVRWMWVRGLSQVASTPRPGFELYYQDLLYQTALTGELRRNLVPGYPMVDGEPLGYHWFFHAVAAQLSGTGIDDLDVVTRLLPSTLIVLLVLLASAVGHQVAGHWAGGVGAAAVLALTRPAQADTWTPAPLSSFTSYWQLSPTATLGWVFGLAAVGCLVAMLRRGPADALAPTAVLPLFAAGAAGAKSAALPVIVCGVGLAALVVLAIGWTRRSAGRTERSGTEWSGTPWNRVARRYVVALVVLVVITVLALVFIYPGSYGLRLDLTAWPKEQNRLFYGEDDAGRLAELGAMGVGFLRRWATTLLPCLGLVFLVRRRADDPSGWMGLGMVTGGMVALLAFHHPSASQLYFPIAALPLAYALSGAGLGLFVKAALQSRVLARAGASGAAAVAVAQTHAHEHEHVRHRVPAQVAASGPSAGSRRETVGGAPGHADDAVPTTDGHGGVTRRPSHADAVAAPRLRALVGLVVLGVAVLYLVRLLVPSGGTRPRSLGGSFDHSTLQTLSTWVAPTLTLLLALVALATLAWFVARSGGRRLPGAWAALLAVAVISAGFPVLIGDLSLTANPGAPRSPSAATDVAHRPAVTPALFTAGQYLRRNASPSDVIATNRVFNGVTRGNHKDNRDFSVSALSGLRSDVGGFGYAPRMLETLKPGSSYIIQPFWDQPRLDAELALVEHPTAESLAAAYRTRGVRWIVADERSGPVSPQLATLTDLVSHVDGVWLARLRPPSG